MTEAAPRIARAIDIATAFMQRELKVRARLNPQFCREELWAAVTTDGRIFIGTPLLRGGEGTYVDHDGQLTAA